MDNIKELTLEGLVIKVIALQEVMEGMTQEIAVYKDEIADRLEASKVTGTKVGNYLVKRVIRKIFTGVSLAIARELGAVKEVVDSEKLSQLNKKGIDIKGSKTIQYVSIKEVE